MKVLVFVNYFFPAYKSGGPLKSLQGLIDYLGEEVEFSIITNDRDVDDAEPFPDTETDCWVQRGNCRVYYTNRISRASLAKVLRGERWDLLYLQSFFSPRYTLKPLLWWKLGFLKAQRLLVAPRGEFSPGAIRIKATKKRIFLQLAKWLHLYKGAYWQASSEREKNDILREIPHLASPKRIFTASDIPSKPLPVSPSETESNLNKGGRLRVLHLSRITPMKNLAFALQVLSKLPFPIELNIYGPIDDPEYWQTCQPLLESLPDHIDAKYHGPVPPSQVPAEFSAHDVFFLPTRGENFGHVVFESLQNGCPVLLSDQTPWQDLLQKQAGWVLPLDNQEAFQQALTDLNNESKIERANRRNSCLAYAEQFLAGGDIVQQNRQMFETLLKTI